MFEFDFERLDVYKIAIEFYRKVLKISKHFPKEIQYSIGEQFRRAALSISNNIAEGSGKESKKEKSYFYSTSMHSCRECIPMITILIKEEIISKDGYEELRNYCIRITSMLKKLILSVNDTRSTVNE